MTTVSARPDVDLLDGTFYGGDPHPAFAWMRRSEPVYRDEANALWGITRHADIRALGADPGLASSAGGSRPDAPHMPFMNNYDDPEHRRRRGLVSQGFTARRVTAMEPHIREIVDGILDRVCERGACDFVTDVAAPLPIIVIGELLGFAPEDFDELLRWSDEMVAALGAPDPAAMETATRAFADYSGYISRVIEECRASGSRDNPVAVFVHAEFEGERLDHDSLIYETLNLLIGGDETTRHAISGGMRALLENPEQLEALRADRSLLPGAVEEMLRWTSPITGWPGRRRATPSCAAPASPRATACSCSTRRATATRTCSTTRSASTSAGRPTSTSRSATARTSAWARRWPAWRCGSCSTGC